MPADERPKESRRSEIHLNRPKTALKLAKRARPGLSPIPRRMRAQGDDGKPNSAAGNKPKSGDMNKSESGKSKTDSANPPGQDRREGQATKRARVLQVRRFATQGQTRRQDQQPGSISHRIPSRRRGRKARHPSQPVLTNAPMSQKRRTRLGRKRQVRVDRPIVATRVKPLRRSPMTAPSQAPKTAVAALTAKPDENKTTDGTEPKSKDGAGSKPGDSTKDGRQSTGADQKSESGTASKGSRDGMKPDDGQQPPTPSGSQKAGDRESTPGSGKPDEESKDKPRDKDKVGDPKANSKNRTPGEEPSPSEMSEPKAGRPASDPKAPRTKGDPDQRADRKVTDKTDQPDGKEASKAKDGDKTAVDSQPKDPRNTMPADERNREAHDPRALKRQESNRSKWPKVEGFPGARGQTRREAGSHTKGPPQHDAGRRAKPGGPRSPSASNAQECIRSNRPKVERSSQPGGEARGDAGSHPEGPPQYDRAR